MLFKTELAPETEMSKSGEGSMEMNADAPTGRVRNNS